MLERQGLVLTGWMSLAQLPVSVSCAAAIGNRIRGRPILDLGTRRFLGFASSAKLSGQALFSRSALEVYETEDAALLLTLHRPWLLGWAWDICDAEERRIGILYRGSLYDGAGTRFGVLELAHAAERGRFADVNGCHLGAFELRDDEFLLSFGRACDGEPFIRMNLLAAVLAISDRLLLKRRRAASVQPATGVQPC